MCSLNPCLNTCSVVFCVQGLERDCYMYSLVLANRVLGVPGLG